MRATGFGYGRVARITDTHRVERRQREDQCRRRTASQQRRTMASIEFAKTIAGRIGARVERLLLQVMIDVAQQCVHGAIAPRRVAMHRGQTEHVQIGPRSTTCARAASRRVRRHRRSRCFRSEDHAFHLTGRVSGDVERQPSGQQLVQHHTKCVDVGAHAGWLAAHLLRCGVRGRQHLQAGARCRIGVAVLHQLLRDAEVDQLHPSISLDEDV